MGDRESGAMPASSDRFRRRAGMGTEEARLGDGQRPRAVANIAALAKDCARLLDLQLQLLAVDGKEYWSSLKRQLVVLATAGLLALSAMTITLASLAAFVFQAVGSWGWSLLAIGGGGLIVSGVMLAVAATAIKKAGGSWSRSQEELTENVKWVREILHHDEHEQVCRERELYEQR